MTLAAVLATRRGDRRPERTAPPLRPPPRAAAPAAPTTPIPSPASPRAMTASGIRKVLGRGAGIADGTGVALSPGVSASPSPSAGFHPAAVATLLIRLPILWLDGCSLTRRAAARARRQSFPPLPP